MCHHLTTYDCGHVYMSPVLSWCICSKHSYAQVAAPCSKPGCCKKTESEVPATPAAHTVSKVTIGNRNQRKCTGNFIDVFNK